VSFEAILLSILRTNSSCSVCVGVYLYKINPAILNNEIGIYSSVYTVSNVRIISELERKWKEMSMA
jgi:hypothetical protein